VQPSRLLRRAPSSPSALTTSPDGSHDGERRRRAPWRPGAHRPGAGSVRVRGGQQAARRRLRERSDGPAPAREATAGCRPRQRSRQGPRRAWAALRSRRQIPFPSAWFRGVLLECSLSVMEDPDAVLRECRRVAGRGRAPDRVGPLRPEVVAAWGLPRTCRHPGRPPRASLEKWFSAERFEEHPEQPAWLLRSDASRLGAGAFEENVGID
jgi:hypothetical protein